MAWTRTFIPIVNQMMCLASYYLSVCLSVCLSAYLPVYNPLSVVGMFGGQNGLDPDSHPKSLPDDVLAWYYISYPFICLSICLPVYNPLSVVGMFGVLNGLDPDSHPNCKPDDVFGLILFVCLSVCLPVYNLLSVAGMFGGQNGLDLDSFKITVYHIIMEWNSVSLSVYLPVYLSVCLPVYNLLSVAGMFGGQNGLDLDSFKITVYHIIMEWNSVSLSVYLPVYLSVCLSTIHCLL